MIKNKGDVNYSLSDLKTIPGDLHDQLEALVKNIEKYEQALTILKSGWRTSHGVKMCEELESFKDNELRTFVKEVNIIIGKTKVVYENSVKAHEA